MFNFLKKKIDNRADFDIQRKLRENFNKMAKNFRTKESSPTMFKKLHYPAWAVKAMGYTAREMKDGGYSARALKMAGFSDDAIARLFKVKE